MPRCQPASPASPKGKYVKVSLDGKRQLKLKLRSKPGAHGEKFRGVEKTTAGNFQAFVHKKGMKVGVGTFDTEEAAATHRALEYANNLENVLTPGRKDKVDMDFDQKLTNALEVKSSPLSNSSPLVPGWLAQDVSGPLCWPAYGFKGRKPSLSKQAQAARATGTHKTLLQRHLEAHPQLARKDSTVQTLKFNMD